MKKHFTIPANNKVTFKVSIFTSFKAILQLILPLRILLLFATSLKWHLGHKLVRVNKIASQTVQQRTAVNTRSGTVIRDLTKLRRRRHRKRQKSHRLNGQNNNSARTSGFLVNLFAVPVQLHCEMAKLQVYLRTGTARRQILPHLSKLRRGPLSSTPT